LRRNKSWRRRAASRQFPRTSPAPAVSLGRRVSRSPAWRRLHTRLETGNATRLRHARLARSRATRTSGISASNASARDRSGTAVMRSVRELTGGGSRKPVSPPGPSVTLRQYAPRP
jgi:hypothetical protein